MVFSHYIPTGRRKEQGRCNFNWFTTVLTIEEKPSSLSIADWRLCIHRKTSASKPNVWNNRLFSNGKNKCSWLLNACQRTNTNFGRSQPGRGFPQYCQLKTSNNNLNLFEFRWIYELIRWNWFVQFSVAKFRLPVRNKSLDIARCISNGEITSWPRTCRF